MSMHAMSMLPRSIIGRIADPGSFARDLNRYREMSDEDLLQAVEVCLKNLQRIDEDTTIADADLQVVLVPELCDRITPGVRDRLRRISSSLAEYGLHPGRPSPFRRLLSPEAIQCMRDGACELRKCIARAAILDIRSLAHRVKFALAGSRAAHRWGPSDYVYEPGFTYRLVPMLTLRALDRAPDRDRSS